MHSAPFFIDMTTKRAAAPVDDTIAEPVAARLGKRDGLECYVFVTFANFEDCSGLCDFMQQYGANLALIPAFDEVYWELGTCTLGVTNHTPCANVVPYGFFFTYCTNLLVECIYYGADGVFDIDSNGMSAALFGNGPAPAYSPLAC